MNKAVVKKWIAALRSGDYVQCTGKLRKNDTYCVLGVLCDIHSKETGRDWEKDDLYSELSHLGMYRYDNKIDQPSDAVEKWLGSSMLGPLVGDRIESEGPIYGSSLVSLNDDRISFDILANIIEKRAKAIDPSFVA